MSSSCHAGAVFRVISDGAGGWYYGGSFDAVDGLPRANFAHQLADGSWDSWPPAFDGPVHALALDEGALYAGGGFTSMDGVGRWRACGSPGSRSANA